MLPTLVWKLVRSRTMLALLPTVRLNEHAPTQKKRSFRAGATTYVENNLAILHVQKMLVGSMLQRKGQTKSMLQLPFRMIYFVDLWKSHFDLASHASNVTLT